MSMQSKREQDPDCYSFQCTSEVILETDVIKIEVDENIEYEDNAESTEIKLESVETDQLKTLQEVTDKDIDELVDVNAKITTLENPAIVPTRLQQSQIKANDIFEPKKDKNDETVPRRDVCERAFSQMISEKHLNTRNIKPYVCNVCNEGFERWNKLHQHKFSHTKEKTFSCDFCGKMFSQKRNLRDHLNTHYKLKPYVCNICDKCFSFSSNLRQHQSVHTGKKPFACGFCKKTFRFKVVLKNHLNTHNEIKPYVCHICNKGYSQLRGLHLHEYTHTGKKPFSCNLCKKTFSRQSSLNTHLNIHSNVKPYVCNVCNRGFSGSSNLHKHKAIHVKKKTFCIDEKAV